ncbi:hypothetical protein B0J18DRAFT_472556 [Chaetomium sp. MPI-SDFR-AT-0129]|nr:hypothetical protein B0J18DRAFT_472556 [Chaetomium sp. MPI-SDFR-AT-0129]
MPVHSAFLVLLLLQAAVSLSLTLHTNPLPFQHVRKPIFAPLPIDKHASLTDPPSRPAFQPGKAYTYSLALNTTSELYSYNYQHDSETGGGMADADSSGFSAAVASNLTILTQADSPEPGTLIFLAWFKLVRCLMSISVWVTQDLTSGEFKNVYYNASVTYDPASQWQDPLGYHKLIVSSLRTLQSYYNGSESYEHETTDRFGNTRTVQYRYIGKLADSQCWQADSQSINGDELAADTKNVCWSPAGGVSAMTGGDATELGTTHGAAETVDKVAASSGLYATLSQNGTLEVVQGGIPILVNYSSCSGPFSDIQQGQSANSDTQLLLGLSPTGQFWPFHPSIPVQATLYGFFLSDELNPYILYLANGDTQPSVSQFPSSANVNDILSFLHLAPVGPTQPNPVVAGILEDQNFTYSVWNPPAYSALINPAEGFLDWVGVDLGGPALSVEPWHFDGAGGPDDGVFIVMQNSTVVTMQLTPSGASPWGAPSLIPSPNGEGPFIGALDISFDKFGTPNNPYQGRALVGTYPLVNVTTLSYQGSGVWAVDGTDWEPFTTVKSPPDETGFPPTTALSQVSANATAPPVDLTPDQSALLLRLGGLLPSYTMMSFDDPQWMQSWPLNNSYADVLGWISSITANPSDTNTLIDFRRNISRAGEEGRNLICAAIQSQDVNLNNDGGLTASVLMGTLASFPLTIQVLETFEDVVLAQTFSTTAKIAAIQESVAMNCAAKGYAYDLASIANNTVPAGSSDDLEAAASAALGSFAAKPPCPWDGDNTPEKPMLEPHHIVHLLHNKTVDEDRHDKLLTALYGLANTRHPHVIDKVDNFTEHDNPVLRVAAVRAIANVPNERATGHLVYHSLHNSQPAARRAGLQALQHHDHHENPVLATKTLLTALFQPRVRRTPADLRGLKGYFQKRMTNSNNNNNRLADYRLARIGMNRITLVEKATLDYPVPGVSSPLFTPLHWSRSYGGENVRATVGVVVDSDFDATGAGFHAEAFVLGSLFSTDIDIASAGAYASWTSSGSLSFFLWTAVFLFDPVSLQQVPYYLIGIEWFSQTVFQLVQGDPCTIQLPSNPAVTVRETRSFVQATYYYGIPLIAEVDLHVELVGWFEVGYGVELVTQNLSSPIPGQITGYIRPGMGLGGQISANVRVLVASGGLEGDLEFASLYLPAGGGMTVNSLSPLAAGFGDSIQINGEFLRGRVALYYEIWNCCCWYCWFTCCFDCGGGCNYRGYYTLFSWDGIPLPVIYIDNRPNLCASLRSAAELPHRALGSGVMMLQGPQLADYLPYMAPPPLEVTDGDEIVDMDAENWMECGGYYDLRSRLVQLSTCSYQSMDCDGMSLATRYMLPEDPNVDNFAYDCNRYPELCQNTECWRKWSPYSAGARKKIQWEYDDVYIPRRRWAMSRLGSPPAGTQRDEVPMNKCTDGGCCARVQAIEASQNSAHGGDFCGFLRSNFGPAPGYRPVKGEFTVSYKTPPPATDKATCKGDDFRFEADGGDSYRQPSTRSCAGDPPCEEPNYGVALGLPRFEKATMTAYLSGSNHPQLAFNFDDKVDVHYQPILKPNLEAIRYSHLQNLTVGSRALAIHGNFTSGAERWLHSSTGAGGDIFQLTLDHELVSHDDKRDTTHSRVTVHLAAEYSHLVYHPGNPAHQRQVDSRAEMCINVSDAAVLQRLLGSPAVFKAKGAEQKPVAPPVTQQPLIQPPSHLDRGSEEAISKPFRVADLASLRAMKSHVHDLGASNTDDLGGKAFSLREIILTVLLLGLSVVYLFKTA